MQSWKCNPTAFLLHFFLPHRVSCWSGFNDVSGSVSWSYRVGGDSSLLQGHLLSWVSQSITLAGMCIGLKSVQYSLSFLRVFKKFTGSQCCLNISLSIFYSHLIVVQSHTVNSSLIYTRTQIHLGNTGEEVWPLYTIMLVLCYRLYILYTNIIVYRGQNSSQCLGPDTCLRQDF